MGLAKLLLEKFICIAVSGDNIARLTPGIKAKKVQGTLQRAVDNLLPTNATLLGRLQSVFDESDCFGNMGVAADRHRRTKLGTKARHLPAVIGTSFTTDGEGGVVDLDGDTKLGSAPGNSEGIDREDRIAQVGKYMHAMFRHQMQQRLGILRLIVAAEAAIFVKPGHD